jgi:phosphoadenosine phosphosulfate reductase
MHGSRNMLMPRDILDLGARVAGLNDRYRHHAATEVVAHALRDAEVGRVALVSSFGAESVVLLHMAAITRRDTPVLFLETGMLFAETLTYQMELCERLGLTDVRLISPHPAIASADPDGTLHAHDPDTCCDLRKTRPLAAALEGFDAWITGRKRYQGTTRAALEFFEVEDATGRIKVNPLAHWTRENLADYMDENRLPRHPLVARGYPSIGCAPCTSPVAAGEDERAGRWRGQTKVECGIHFVNGKAVRGPLQQENAA